MTITQKNSAKVLKLDVEISISFPMDTTVVMYFSFFISFNGFTLTLQEKAMTVSQPVYGCKSTNALETNCMSLSTYFI